MIPKYNFKIILSPAKRIKDSVDEIDVDSSIPEFLDRAEEIVSYLKTLMPNELGELLGTGKKLAELNFMRYAKWSVPFNSSNSIPSILAFAGDVYNGLNASDFSKQELIYANDVICILSGLYGVVRPLDLIQPYRLEMATKIRLNEFSSLYEFWGNAITNHIFKRVEGGFLVNLASKEYARVLNRKVFGDRFINIVFKENRPEGPKVIPIHSKRARGLMSRFAVKNQIRDVNNLKLFDYEGYSYSDSMSNNSNWVFIR